MDYWTFGTFGSLPDARIVCRNADSLCKRSMVKIWAGDQVHSAHRVSVDVAYWPTLWALIKALPRMLLR